MTREIVGLHEDFGKGYVPECWADTDLLKDSFDWIRFTRLENVPLLGRRRVDEAASLGLWSRVAGCTPDDLIAVLTHLRDRVDRIADLLVDDLGIELLGAIAEPGSRVVAVGDSITADRLGWASLLETMLAKADRSITFINSGLAGTTSTDTIERLDLIAATKPDVVLLMIGTNDARSQRLLPGQTLVSEGESQRNLDLLLEALAMLASRVIVFTPPPLWAGPSQAAMLDGRSENTSCAEALDRLAEHIRTIRRDVVDLRQPAAFDPMDPLFMAEDGVHPEVSGHIAILKALLRQLN